MKKYILVAVTALVLASTNAMADRIVSGTNGNGKSRGDSKNEACVAAKENALDKRSYNEQVVKYYECECIQNEKERWICTVDARLQKVR